MTEGSNDKWVCGLIQAVAPAPSLLQVTEVDQTDADFATCFLHSVASVAAAKKFCELKAVYSTTGHLCS